MQTAEIEAPVDLGAASELTQGVWTLDEYESMIILDYRDA